MNQTYNVRAYHITEKLRLKDIRDRFQLKLREFSNYEMCLELDAAENSYIFFYNYGSVVFFNVPDERIDLEIQKMAEFKTQSDSVRTSDSFLVEVTGSGQNKAMFDRIQIQALSFDAIKIAAVNIAQSTALEYYEILIENLMERTSRFSRQLEKQGKYLDESEDLIKFIGLCLNTRQEIISNLYIVDSPDEVWENNDLEKLFQELKVLLDIDIRYRALEHKIQIIQESVEVMVDLFKSKKEHRLEMIIIFLIAIEVVLYILSTFFKMKI